jgi:AraC family transcriptional regulator
VFTASHIPQASLLGVGQILPQPDWHSPDSHHAHHELIVVMAGGITVASGGLRVHAGPGSALIYPAGVEHEEWSDRDHPLHSIFLPFTCPGFDGLPVTVIPDNRQAIREVAARIYADRDTSSPAARLQRNAFLHVILAELLRNLGSEDQPMVTNVRRHIRDHLADALTLEGLAKVCGLSKFHFLRQYRMATGRTPMQDVRAMRAEYARELIMSTRLPLKDVAARAGLGDEYSMSRLFRKLFGIPPGRYRRVHERRGRRSGP